MVAASVLGLLAALYVRRVNRQEAALAAARAEACAQAAE
jgi:hypothetical protein